MNNTATFVPPTTLPNNNNSLLIALSVAIIVHLVLVLGMNFTTPQPDKINKPIDITLVNTPVKSIPKQADFLAQENQLGAGEETKKPEPPAKNIPNKVNSQVKQVKKVTPKETKPKETEPKESKPKVVQKIITQPKAEKKVVTASKAEVVSKPEKRPQLTAESLHQQIAQLGTEIRQSQPSADQTKIKFVNSVSAHKYVAAQYMKDWESKVERMGNLNYPEAATKKNFSGTLTMDVGINADGSVYSIRINKSSGNPELDEAAIKIVRMSAPFAPLPLELRKELDVLVITRVWKFSDESGLITR
ncbi:MAG: energy transducer TonB [Methylococcaceae bacterium]|nr:energy transducer TonB [Methylococcaceae bacterium]